MKNPGGRIRPYSHEQPGLEVVPHNSAQWTGLEVDHSPTSREKPGLQVEHASSSHAMPPETPPRHRRKRLWFLLSAVGAIVIIASVVGGVVGSRAMQGKSDTRDDGSGPPPSNATTPLKSIRQGSELSVTGWRKRNGVEIYLSYQGPDDKLRFSRYDSGRGTFTVNNSYWEGPTDLGSSVGPRARIADAMILWDQDFAPQVQFFFTDAAKRLLGVNLNPNHSPKMQDDSIGDVNLTTGAKSSIAAYWPYVVFQDGDGELNEVMNVPFANAALHPAAEWATRKLGVRGADGTRLAVVPLSANYSRIVSKGGYGIFYQRNDGRLFAHIPDLGSLPSNYTSSWPTSDFPSISIPEGNSLAAFATARDSDTNQRVNTYLLYQGSDNHINIVWVDDNTTWKTAAPTALKGADRGTNIACLTMPTSSRDINLQQLQLEQASSETRCYFQRGGIVRETVLSGADWVETGSVPMP